MAGTPPAEHVDDLVADWLVAAERGAAPPLAEVCRDRPELLTELERRVRLRTRCQWSSSATRVGTSARCRAKNSSTGSVS